VGQSKLKRVTESMTSSKTRRLSWCREINKYGFCLLFIIAVVSDEFASLKSKNSNSIVGPESQ
jgi:hypothetical protein